MHTICIARKEIDNQGYYRDVIIGAMNETRQTGNVRACREAGVYTWISTYGDLIRSIG